MSDDNKLKCTKCGSEVLESYNYCVVCGNKLKDDENNKPTLDPYDLERPTYPEDWEILTS
ncbi:MAG: zinc-ribbon domain-containing protein [bacterium]